MHLIEVTDASKADDFIRVNVVINGTHPNYIRPLDKDIHEVFDRKKNKAFRFGDAARWVLRDKDGLLAGRIAAFVSSRYKNKGDEFPVGGIGFFDCIRNDAAAAMLFNVAKHWLMQKGVEAMDGPINFGERDRWWGLLVEGFDPPIYCMNFNPPYYTELFENYGFKPFFNQLCYALKVKDPMHPKFFERHAKIAADPDFSAAHIRKKNLKKFAEDFTIVYNKAWAGHGGLKQLNKEVVHKMFLQMKPIMDERVIWFSYYRKDPIGIWTNLPDINQWFKHLHGNFNFLGKLKFLWIKATTKSTKFTGLVFGIVPEWQGKGVDSYMIVEGAKIIQGKNLYEDYEMQWIGEFNPKMINIAESLGTYRSRKLITYRYLFDQTKPFKAHPLV